MSNTLRRKFRAENNHLAVSVPCIYQQASYKSQPWEAAYVWDHKGTKSRCPVFCQLLGCRAEKLSRKDGSAQRKTSGSLIQSNTSCAALQCRMRKKFRQALCPALHTKYQTQIRSYLTFHRGCLCVQMPIIFFLSGTCPGF